ncbi:MAG: RagB/SusD family nutrient uptake outer membrane protein [Bacteroidota bacterium]
MKKTAIVILVLGIGFFMTNCDDYLEVVPQDAYTDATLFQTEDDLILFLNTVYNQALGFSLTDNWPNRGVDLYTLWTDDGYGARECCSGSNLSDFEFGAAKVPNQYNNPYERIRQVNEFLRYAPQAENSFADPGVYRRYIGEARFFRAYQYHKLSAFFGAVPLVLEPFTDQLSPRNTRLSVFEWVDAELADIANDLPESPEQRGRISKWAAMALRARHLLYAIDWHPDTASLYTRAEPILQDIYANSGHSLEPGADGFARLFTKAGEMTSEALWTKYYSQTTLGGSNSQTGLSHGKPFHSLPPGSAGNSGNRNSNSTFNATSRMVEAFQSSNGLDIRDPANTLYDINNPWANRDPRLDVTIIHSGDELPRRNASGIADTYVVNPHPLEGEVTLDNVSTRNNQVRTGYWFKKYSTDFNWLELNNSKFADSPYHFIRFSEVILMYAEAVLGNANDVGTAMNLVNEVRDRVGMPAVTATGPGDALDRILYERRIEFAGEGDHRYYDIRRHRLGEDLFIGTLPGGGDKGIVYGIPVGTTADNPEENFPQGTLDDASKVPVGTKEFNEFFYAPIIPDQAFERNPLLFDDPVDFGPWVSFFDQE